MLPSRKSRDVFRVGDLTIDSTVNSNESELIFRSKEPPKNAYSGIYYALSSAQADDPTIRINQYANNGKFLNFGYFYDTQFNPVPPGPRVTVVGGIGDRTQEPNPSLTYSYDNIHWYPWSNDVNLLQNGGCTAVAYNGFIFAAGGSATADTKLCYSANGSSWIPADVSSNTFFENGCNVIATNGGFWVAGSSGRYRVINSYDGINWYPSSVLGADSKLTISCKAAAWSGTMWVAGGEGIDNIIHSSDGLSWINSENANSTLKECRTVAWSGSTWIAGGIAADPSGIIIPTNIAYSLDAINWYSVLIATPLRTAYSLRDSCNAVAWSGAMWVAGGEDDASGHTLAYSYDGTAWYPGTPYVFQSCKAVSWNGNSWAAAGTGTNSLATSFDGIHWTPNADGNALLAGGGGAVAVNRILPNAATVQSNNVLSSSNSLNLIGGSGETLIAFSKDGITWTPSISAAKLFAEGACTALSWNGFLWVGGFSNTYREFNIITDRIYFTMGNSEDGVTWTSNTVGSSLLTISCNAVSSSPAIWVAGGSGDHRLITSDATLGAGGIIWIATVNGDTIFDASASNLIDDGVCTTVGWNGTYWVAGSNCLLNRLAFSSDGLTWTGSASGNALFTRCNAVAWNGLQWIAAGKFNNRSVVASSQNGQTWTPVSDYGGYAVSGITWNTVACNESIWLLGGDVSSGDTPILFSYDGQNWSQALGTEVYLSRGCKSITWDGNLWMAVGSGSNNAIYSYNGAVWNNTYNGDSLFGTGAVTVAANRPQPTAGNTRPTPTLYATTLGQGLGRVTFTPADKGLNSLYPAGNLFIDDVCGTMGLNIVPTTHTDNSGVNIDPILDIIGKTPATNGIYMESYAPILSLVNNSGHTDVDLNDTPIARIEMYDISTNVGWTITDAFDYDSGLTNHLQLTSWKNRNLYTVVDIAPGDFGAGNVQINGIDPVESGAALYVNAANIVGSNAVSVKGNVHINDETPSDIDSAALYVNGSRNTNSNAITTVGNVYINTPGISASNPGALYVNRVNPDTSDVRFGSDATNLTIRTNNASAAQLVGYPSTRFYRGGLGGYVEFNGTDFFPSPTNTLNLGLSTNHWNNLYTNTINSDGSSVSIGGTYGLRINPAYILPWTVSSVELVCVTSNQPVVINGQGTRTLFGLNTVQALTNSTTDLGAPNYYWSNIYVNQVNPTTYTPSPGSTRYVTYDSSASGIGYLPNPGLPGTYNLYIQLVGGGGGAQDIYGGGGGAFTGIAITGVAPGAQYIYECGGGGAGIVPPAAAAANGTRSYIAIPSQTISYEAFPGRGGSFGSGGAGGTAQTLGGNIVGVSGGSDGGTVFVPGGFGGLAGATYLGQGGTPPRGAGAAGYVSIDTVFVPTPITVNNDLSGITLLDELMIKPGFGGGIGLIANRPQILFGVNGSLNTGQYMFWNGASLGPSLTNTTDLGAPLYHWNNLYTNTINKDRTDLLIGDAATTGNLVVRTSGSTTQVIGYPYLDLKTGYTGGGIRIDGLSTPASVIPFTGTAPNNSPLSLGSVANPWNTLWANAINPGTAGVPDITIVDSSTPGTGSYTLPSGFTYTISVIAVGAGGGGVHWNAYYPGNSAGGGSGGYITGTKTGVPGGTVISWIIGGAGINNNIPNPAVPSPAAAAGGSGNGSAAFIGSLATFAGNGSGGGYITAKYIESYGIWAPAQWIGGYAGTYSTTGSPTTFSGINGNTGEARFDGPPSYPFAYGGPSVYGGYGLGGDGGGGNGTNGYVRIVATDTGGPAVSYNLSSGPVYIDTLYVRNIIDLP